jgi:HAD superfamily hydrolase (TIGR01509 family)
MALASNAEPANISFLLDATGLRPFFRAVVDGHQVLRPKPDPAIFLRAAQLLGYGPANTIVFEDSYAGIEAARRAGARVVGLRTTHSHLPAADLAVDDFWSADLRAWLQRQKAIQP